MCRFIILREGKSCTPVEVFDVVYMVACGAYTNIFLISGTSSKQCGNMSSWQEKIKTSGLFFRIDRSHLVNYRQILSFHSAGYVLLKDKSTRLPLSHEGYIILLDFFR